MTGATVRVRVVEGVAVYDGTTQRSGGAELVVAADVAASWLAAVWVELVQPKTPRKPAT